MIGNHAPNGMPHKVACFSIQRLLGGRLVPGPAAIGYTSINSNGQSVTGAVSSLQIAEPYRKQSAAGTNGRLWTLSEYRHVYFRRIHRSVGIREAPLSTATTTVGGESCLRPGHPMDDHRCQDTLCHIDALTRRVFGES